MNHKILRLKKSSLDLHVPPAMTPSFCSSWKTLLEELPTFYVLSHSPSILLEPPTAKLSSPLLLMVTND